MRSCTWVHTLLLITGSVGRIGGKQQSMVVSVLRTGTNIGAAQTAASDNQIHSWLPWAGALRLSAPQALVGQSSAATPGASELWFVTLLIPLHTTPVWRKQERSHCAGADVLFFSSRCCFIGRLTLWLTLAYFLPYAFPKAAFVLGASWVCAISLIQCCLCPPHLAHRWVCNWHFPHLLQPGGNNCRPVCLDRLMIN